MSLENIVGVKRSNQAPERASAKRSELRWMADMMRIAAAFWPKKTAQNMAHATHVSERAAEFWIAGKYDMSLSAARHLLRSDEGFDYLVALVGEDCEALWFQRVKLAHEVGVTSRRIKSEEKRIAQLRAKQQQLTFDLDE
jgi:hypothetical protein